MTIGFLNLTILLGLAAVAIPPIIHFFNRRRHDVVDWAAMQFLQVNPAKKRRIFIEELLLMVLRMGMIALLVAAFAAPYISGPLVAGWTRAPRDIMLVLDASGSMALQVEGRPTPWVAAQEWIEQYLDDAHPADRIGLMLASQPPQMLVEPGVDRDWLRYRLTQLGAPAGAAEGPRAVHDAWTQLRASSETARSEIILLTDHQRFGWTDPASVLQWQQLGRDISATGAADDESASRLSMQLQRFGIASDLAAASNVRLAPLRAERALVGVGQKLRFRSGLHLDNVAPDAPLPALRLQMDDQPAGDLALSFSRAGSAPQAPLEFELAFARPGLHRVTVLAEAEPPHDALPEDSRQDLVIEAVQELPILLIDGGNELSPRSSTFFLAQAFANPSDDKHVSFVKPRRTTIADFDAEKMLQQADPRPRVVVLADVPRLSEAQRRGLSTFVEEGGGLLVALGARVDVGHYNEALWHAGAGWLPARLERLMQVEPGQGTTLQVKQFTHPSLELFRNETHCTLDQAEYTRWWRVTSGPGTAIGAMFANNDPWLLQKTWGRGTVLLSTLPLDTGAAWDNPLPRAWEYPVLVHELVYALANLRGGAGNLRPGEPLRLDPAGRGLVLPTPARGLLRGPGKRLQARSIASWPLVWENPGPAGVYGFEVEDGPSWPIVIHGDARESDLTPQDADDWRRVSEVLPLQWSDDDAAAVDPTTDSQDIWWLLLIGVVGLLCGELWLTRQMVLDRGRA